MGQSGRQLGKIAVRNLKALIDEYEESGKLLPLRKSGEALHLGNICKAVGVVRTTVNTNPDFKKTLRQYAKEKGIAYSLTGRVAAEEEELVEGQMVPVARLQDAQMRLAAAERKNAELRAENASLRARLMRGDEVAELIAFGGRIEPGKV
ncbi:hypothetical protein [Ruegeria sp. HKCCD6109]|uniref:hypothetical protein n=1 Tax=Ruegeria sp. HKCCD6109 TaxID=2683017 RepID=UPI0014914D14|nr:hypothetical protein [Ruegeria sp. HKCCD6109]NOD62721.1 hypothetical protein [Ruegeria sp. HKCCD6109]